MQKGIITYLFFASIYVTGNGLAEIGFTLQWYYLFQAPFLLLAIVYYRSIDLKVLLTLLFLTLYGILFFNEGGQLVLKQIINISFSVFVFYYFIKLYDFDIVFLFQRYVTFSKGILVLGFFQVLIYSLDLLGFSLSHYFLNVFFFLRGADITFRFQSIAQEPSYIAYTFSPIVFMAFYGLFTRRYVFINGFWSFLFIVAYLLTFSLTAYLGIIFMLLIFYYRRLTISKLVFSAVFLAMVALFSFLSYRNIPLIKIRVDETIKGLSENIVENGTFRQFNFSTYAILTNLYVVGEGLKEDPIAGYGLGTYELLYDRHLPSALKNYAIINNKEANSMFLRILGELGIVGLLVFICFVIFNRMRFHKLMGYEAEALWIINTGVFIMIILFMIRNGNYTFHGRLFFLLSYYYSYQLSKIHLINSEANTISHSI